MIHLTWSWWSFCSLNAGLNWWHFSPRKPPRLEEIWYPSRDETQGVPLRTAPTWLSTIPSTQPHIKRWVLCHFPPLLKVTQHQFCCPVGWSGHSPTPPPPTFTEEWQGHIVKEPVGGKYCGHYWRMQSAKYPPPRCQRQINSGLGSFLRIRVTNKRSDILPNWLCCSHPCFFKRWGNTLSRLRWWGLLWSFMPRSEKNRNGIGWLVCP